LGLLFVPFDAEGIPLKQRVGRHMAAIKALAAAFSDLFPEKAIAFDGFPDPAMILREGIGTFLHPPNRQDREWKAHGNSVE
jgi:hypothetical protein